MKVSVIVPAYNAESTISQTLDSLLQQSHQNWQAIIVNDGSTDNTLSILNKFSELDKRILIVNQEQMGEAGARNTGVKNARYEWLLFLDSDDWILPGHLKTLLGILNSNPIWDAVHCGWTRVDKNGKFGPAEYCNKSGDLFEFFARYCAFPVHACIIRRSLVENVGKFDTSFRTFPDWDLWQRIARTGAKFASCQEVLSIYRMIPNSASLDALQLFKDGLRLIRQGHSRDPRVPNPRPEYADGLPSYKLLRHEYYLMCWCAGLQIGQGKETKFLTDKFKSKTEPELDPSIIAKLIFRSVPFSICQSYESWVDIWPYVKLKVDNFLNELESESMATGLAIRTRKILEGLISQNHDSKNAVTIGSTYSVKIDLTERIPNIHFPRTVEVSQCTINLESNRIGTISLPVLKEDLFRTELSNAVADNFAWPIVGHFFKRGVYKELKLLKDVSGLSLWRGNLCIAEGLQVRTEVVDIFSYIHKIAGWVIFLQEFWGRPDWPLNFFYEPQPTKEASTCRYSKNGIFEFEITDGPLNIKFTGGELRILPKVGGLSLGEVTINMNRNIIYANELLVETTKAFGIDLCKAAVKRALIGKCLEKNRRLRTLLRKSSLIGVSENRENTGIPEKDSLFSENSKYKISLNNSLELIPQRNDSEMIVETKSRTPTSSSDLCLQNAPELILNQNRFGTLDLEIIGFRLVDHERLEVRSPKSGEALRVEIDFFAPYPIDSPIFGVSIRRNNADVCNYNTSKSGFRLPSVLGNGTIALCIDGLELDNGEYFVSIGAYEKNWTFAYDFHWQVYSLSIRFYQSLRKAKNPQVYWELKNVDISY